MAARGLGKGLDALIPQDKVPVKKESGKTTTKKGEGVEYVKISLVEPNPKQPRKTFSEDDLQELSDSIKQNGIIQPILVQQRKDHYEIIAGERRWRASRLAGLKEVPVIIRDYSEETILKISLLENTQRKDLNPIEEALAYKRLMDEFGKTQDEIAEEMSKSRVSIANTIRLLKLCTQVQDMLIDEMISEGHARALLGIDDSEEQYKMAMQAFDEKLSVREVEKMVKKSNDPKANKEKNKKADQDYIYTDLEEKLKIALGTKVAICAKDAEKGKIEIDYYSKEDLERITDQLLGNNE